MRSLRWQCGLFLSLLFTVSLPAAEPKRLEGFVDRIVPIEGGRLCCAHRAGSGPTLVLIPGTFSDSRVFAKLIPHLDADYDLLIMENRGLGKSWPPPTDGSIEQCARDTLHVLKSLGVDSFYVGGHSLGGMIAVEIAGEAPEKVQGVLSLEGWSHCQAAKDAFDSDMRATLTPSQIAEKQEYRIEVLARWSDEQQAAFGKIWRKWDGRPILEKTEIPVLEIYGDRGREKPTRRELHLPDRANIRLVIIPNSSHSLHIQHPQKVAETMNDFITEQQRSAK